MASSSAPTGSHSIGPPPLLHLTTQIVASNIEKYPAGVWFVLSESQWDQIIRARVAQKSPKKKTTAASQNDHNNINNSFAAASLPPSSAAANNRVTLPPISAKHLSAIEQHAHNAHLARSSTADELLWQHILNYKYREKTMNRPTSLTSPLNYVQLMLKECADNLTRCVESASVDYNEFVAQCTNEEDEKNRREKERNEDDLLLFGDSDHSDNEEQPHQQQLQNFSSMNDQLMQRRYRQHMKQLANQNFETLKRTCYTLSESPMDVQLLSETKIGRGVAKAVKVLTKLKRKREGLNNDGVEEEEQIEIREMFWKRVVRWDGPIICFASATTNFASALSNDGAGEGTKPHHRDRRVMELTLLEFLEQLLDDWKEMASDNGVEINSGASAAATSPPKKKKRRLETNQTDNNHDNDPSNNTKIRVTTCGRDKHISINQHLADMKLLHNSPDWRSLYASLTNRELELRKSHGEKVRATREHLERDRPKIGKVILKRAVGRVKGGDVGLGGGSVGSLVARRNGSNDVGGEEANTSSLQMSNTNTTVSETTKSLATLAAETKAARQEAILNKSKGLRALQKQRSSLGGTSSTKVSQIRQTSKVAAQWGKSSFGNSVASAAGVKNSVRKVGMRKEQAQVQVSLQNGKTMMLPASNAAGKSTGKFSSLQLKMAARSRDMKKRK